MTKDAQSRKTLSHGGAVIPAVVTLLLIMAMATFIWPDTYRLKAESNDQPEVAISNWAADTSLPVALASRNAIVYGDYVMVFGGRDQGDGSSRQIYAAQIQSDGRVGTWAAPSTMPKSLYLHSLAVYDRFVYVIGGWNANEANTVDSPNNTVWRGELTNDGRALNWVEIGTYPTKVTLHKSFTVGNRLYAFGGYANVTKTTLANVYYADIDPSTGNLGLWQAGPSLPQPLRRFGFTSATISGTTYVYVTGGSGLDDNSAFNVVYYAAISSDGTLGAWQSGTPLPEPRYYHDSVIHDGQLLVIGGKNQTGEYNTVWAASLGADGAIGSWRSLASIPETRNRFAAVSVSRYGSDFVFVIGGYVDTVAQSAVYHSTLPNTPTPTATATQTNTPTPTATPTPTPGLNLQFSHEPSGWVGLDEQVEYTIEFVAPTTPLSDVRIESELPSNVELVENSITVSNEFPFTVTQDGIISWQIGNLEELERGTIAYRVKRPIPSAQPDLPTSVLQISLSGPEQAEADIPFSYELKLVNRSVIPLTDIIIRNTVPFGASYVSGVSGPPINGEVMWTLPALAPFATTIVTYEVVAQRSLLNNIYSVESSEGANAIGDGYVVTDINNTRPIVGDAYIIVHNGPRAYWRIDDVDMETSGSQLVNPTFFTFLPSVFTSN